MWILRLTSPGRPRVTPVRPLTLTSTPPALPRLSSSSPWAWSSLVSPAFSTPSSTLTPSACTSTQQRSRALSPRASPWGLGGGGEEEDGGGNTLSVGKLTTPWLPT